MTQICHFISMIRMVGPFPSPTKTPLLSPTFWTWNDLFYANTSKPLPISKVPDCEFIFTSCPGHMPLYCWIPQKGTSMGQRWDPYPCSWFAHYFPKASPGLLSPTPSSMRKCLFIPPPLLCALSSISFKDPPNRVCHCLEFPQWDWLLGPDIW